MAQQFKPGDTVKLKSGGPLMTVIAYGSYLAVEGYKCKWFDDKHKLTESVFTEPELMAAIEVKPAGGGIRYGATKKGA